MYLNNESETAFFQTINFTRLKLKYHFKQLFPDTVLIVSYEKQKIRTDCHIKSYVTPITKDIDDFKTCQKFVTYDNICLFEITFYIFNRIFRDQM